jgi:hypothetical protein
VTKLREYANAQDRHRMCSCPLYDECRTTETPKVHLRLEQLTWEIRNQQGADKACLGDVCECSFGIVCKDWSFCIIKLRVHDDFWNFLVTMLWQHLVRITDIWMRLTLYIRHPNVVRARLLSALLQQTTSWKK